MQAHTSWALDHLLTVKRPSPTASACSLLLGVQFVRVVFPCPPQVTSEEEGKTQPEETFPKSGAPTNGAGWARACVSGEAITRLRAKVAEQQVRPYIHAYIDDAYLDGRW